MTKRRDQLWAIAGREFTTVLRTPASIALAVLFGLVVLAVPVLGGAGGYLPLVLNLLTPVEVLVPVLAFGLGYRAIRAEADRGELELARTYPLARSTYLAGVFVGRVAVLATAVVVALLVALVFVPLADQPAPSFLAVHGTIDDPTYYARFVVLSLLYAVVALAAALAVSSLARSGREAIGLAVGVLLFVVVGFELAVVAGLGRGVLGADLLGVVLAVSPASAFRGLALATAAAPLSDVGPATASAIASVLGLVAWLAGSIAIATLGLWRE